MADRPWLSREIALLADRPPVEAALLLGRTECAVKSAAWRAGFRPRRARLTRRLSRRLKRLHAAGLSINATARRLELHPSTCLRFLRRLNLPPQRPRGPDAEALARDVRRRNRLARSWGYRDWAAYLLSRRRLRYDAVHPGCATRAQAEVCLALKGGPLTRKAIRGCVTVNAQSVRRAVVKLVEWGIVVEAEGVCTLTRPVA